MICCANCSAELGPEQSFGFLEMQEKNGGISLHFVLQRDLLEKFVSSVAVVETEFIENRYYVVSCKKCGCAFGKKFSPKIRGQPAPYIAFGKEKITYGHAIAPLKKNQKWAVIVTTEPFSSYPRFSPTDFVVASGRPKTNHSQGRGGGNYDTSWGKVGGGGRGFGSGRGRGSGFDNQRSVAFNSERSQRGRDDMRSTDTRVTMTSSAHPVAPPVVPERKLVGTSAHDYVSFLAEKMNNWESSKLIYELSGPNKKNW